jgi:hypothetical protein
MLSHEQHKIFDFSGYRERVKQTSGAEGIVTQRRTLKDDGIKPMYSFIQTTIDHQSVG